MKPIEERAREYAKPIEISDELLLRKEAVFLIEKQAFIAGARSEHEELTRWHDPNDPPKEFAPVLLKYEKFSWETNRPMYRVGFYACGGYAAKDDEINLQPRKVIGWREIHE